LDAYQYEIEVQFALARFFLNLPLAGELGGGDSARSDAEGEKGE